MSTVPHKKRKKPAAPVRHEVHVDVYRDDGTGPVTETCAPKATGTPYDPAAGKVDYTQVPEEERQPISTTVYNHQLDITVDGLHYTVVLDGPKFGVYRSQPITASPSLNGPTQLQVDVRSKEEATKIKVDSRTHTRADDLLIKIRNIGSHLYATLDTDPSLMSEGYRATLAKQIERDEQNLAEALLELSHDKPPAVHAAPASQNHHLPAKKPQAKVPHSPV